MKFEVLQTDGVQYNHTRWTDKYLLIKKFNEIGAEMIQVVGTEKSNVTIEKGSLLKTKCERWEMMLVEIETATTTLRIRNSRLSV